MHILFLLHKKGKTFPDYWLSILFNDTILKCILTKDKRNIRLQVILIDEALTSEHYNQYCNE